MLKAQYSYDAWGNHEITVNADGIGSLNPIRYRGYYYDTETGLYYLKSRYYDPEVGRFINADIVENAMMQIDQVNGLNLYSYALNNPVMNVDPTGQFVITAAVLTTLVAVAKGIIVGVAIGAAVGAAGYLTTEAVMYGITGEWNGSWADLGKAVGWGALGGALSGGFGAIKFTGATILGKSIAQLAGQMVIGIGVYTARTLSSGGRK